MAHSQRVPYDELLRRLKRLPGKWEKTHRKGDTGIGKTLEDLLELPENNFPGPDGEKVELKSARRGESMTTLITKSPLPKRANSVILRRFGYPPKPGSSDKILHTTVYSSHFNTIKGKPGFMTRVKDERVELLHGGRPSDSLAKWFVKEGEEEEEEEVEVIGYWDRDLLMERVNEKLNRVLYVLADNRGARKTENEVFDFNEAWLLTGFDYEEFLKMVGEESILTDVRIGQYPDGRPHDHGTGFRVRPRVLKDLFQSKKRVV